MLLRLLFIVIRSLVTGDWWRFCPLRSCTLSIKLNQYLDLFIYRLFYGWKQQQHSGNDFIIKVAIVLILPAIRQSFEATLALTDNCFFSEWPTVLWSGWSTQCSSSLISSDDNQLLVPLLVNLLVHHHLHGHLSDGQLLFFQNDHLSLVLGGPVLIIPISHLGISSSSSYIWASLLCEKYDWM